jgi:hypothetical protein
MNGWWSRAMDLAKVAQMVNVLNGLTARDALCMLVGCMLAVFMRQQSLDNCIDLLKGLPVGWAH